MFEGAAPVQDDSVNTVRLVKINGTNELGRMLSAAHPDRMFDDEYRSQAIKSIIARYKQFTM